MKNVTQDQIIEAARQWVGTPYVHQARGPKGPEGGTDCVGLLIAVATELGIIEQGYDPTGYSWITDGTQLRVELSRWAECVAFSDTAQDYAFWAEVIQPGDIAVFNVMRHPQHTAFVSKIDYGNGGTFIGMIHAYDPAKKVVEHIFDERWFSRLTSVWRLR